jgi:hypothetical protein
VITYEEAKTRLQAVVAEVGEGYVPEERCAYFNESNQPSCIIGRAFAAELREKGVGWGAHDNTTTVTHLINHGILKADPKARKLLAETQHAQDIGESWGEAVRIGIQWSV